MITRAAASFRRRRRVGRSRAQKLLLKQLKLLLQLVVRFGIGGYVVLIAHLDIVQNVRLNLAIIIRISARLCRAYCAAHGPTPVDELQINAPVGRVEAPVARVRLVLVRVAHEILGRVQFTTRVALHARRVRFGVHLDVYVPVGLAEALVDHFDRRLLLARAGAVAQR